jgi:hypothetical protein
MRIVVLIGFSLCLQIGANGGRGASTPVQFNVECPAKRLCPDLEKFYQACSLTHESEACDSFVKIFRQLVPRYDCQRSFDHTPTKDYTVPAVWVCKEILAAGGKRPVFEESIKLLQNLRINDARSFFGSADFRSVLDGELAETYVGPSVRAEKDMVFQNTLLKPTLLGALPAIGEVLQAPKGANALSFNGGAVHVYHFDVDEVKYFVYLKTDNSVVTNISTRDTKFRTPEGIGIGDTFSKVKALGGKVFFDENDICYLRLPSDWLCTFNIDGEGSCDSRAPEMQVRQLDLLK